MVPGAQAWESEELGARNGSIGVIGIGGSKVEIEVGVRRVKEDGCRERVGEGGHAKKYIPTQGKALENFFVLFFFVNVPEF